MAVLLPLVVLPASRVVGPERMYRSEQAKGSGSRASSTVWDRRMADGSLALASEAEVQLERTVAVSAHDPDS